MHGSDLPQHVHDGWLVFCVVVAFLVGIFLIVFPHGSEIMVFLALIWSAVTALVAGIVARDEIRAQKLETREP